MVARWVNILIAVWVMVVAFAFPNSTAQFVNMLAIGILVLAFETLAFFDNRLRFVDTALGAWLALSAFFFPTHSQFVMWNNLFCGAAIFVLSMVSTSVRRKLWVPDEHRRDAEAL